MNWFILVVAGLFEIGWAVGLKYTDGFTRLWPTVGTVLSMIISLRTARHRNEVAASRHRVCCMGRRRCRRHRNPGHCFAR